MSVVITVVRGLLLFWYLDILLGIFKRFFFQEISLSTPSSIVSAKFLGAVHSAANTERLRLNRKRSYSESSIAEIKEAKARQESDRRWRCLIEGKQMVDAATQVVYGDNFACMHHIQFHCNWITL